MPIRRFSSGDASSDGFQPRIRKVLKKSSELDQDMTSVISKHQSHLYPEAMVTNVGGGNVDMSAITNLNEGDMPAGTPKWALERKKTPCVVAFWHFAPSHTDEIGYAGPVGTFVGSPLLGPAPKGNQAKDKGKGYVQGQNDTKADTDYPMRLDTIRVSFHLDSQTPNIQFTTRKSGERAEDNTIISTRLWAKHFSRDGVDGMVKTEMRPQEKQPIGSLVAHAQQSGNVNVGELIALVEDGKLIEISLPLISGEHAWSGLRPGELEVIRNRSYAESVENKTVTRDLLIQGLEKTTCISVFIRVDQPKWFAEYEIVSQHLQSILTVASHLGNFWFYRHQLEVSGVDGDAIRSAKLPPLNWEVPRWLVRTWQFTMLGDEYLDVVPYTWAPHRMFDDYPDADEYAFLLKMGIIREGQCQLRILQEFVQSNQKTYFDATFMALEQPGQYVVQLFLVNDGVVHADRFKMPNLDMRINIELDPVDPFHPNKTRMVSFRGVVTEDLFDQNAAFCCVVSGPPSVFKGESTVENFPVYISYILDGKPYERQLVAVQIIQDIDSTKKPTGVDMKALFLGDVSNAPSPNFLGLQTSPEQRAEFQRYLDTRKPSKPNKQQMLSALDTTLSGSGVTAIQGPPGCGKTDITAHIANAHARLGRQVLCCAPQNEAVHNFYEKFDAEVKKDGGKNALTEHEYVHFTGAYQRIQDAEKLKRAMLEQDQNLTDSDADVLVEGSNILAEYVRMNTSQGPHYYRTFGYKLKQMINKWAMQEAHIDQPHIESAQQYLKALSESQRITNHRDHKLHSKAIGELESQLGAHYLKNHVKVLFVTLSSSAHPLLVGSFRPIELIIDESAHESIGGLIVPCGAFYKHIKHITLAGDHKQGRGISSSHDTNIGYRALHRNLFAEINENPRKTHKIFLLNESYRMVQELFCFVSQFYDGKPKAYRGAGNIELPLSNTLRAYWKHYARENLRGSYRQVAIDVTDGSVSSTHLAGTTTKLNRGEALSIAWMIRSMLAFEPPESTKDVKYRKITPEDFIVVTPYTGQVLEIRRQLKSRAENRDVDPSGVLVASTSHSQGKQKPIAIFSVVINPGKLEVSKDDHVPIDFVADDHNINVSWSRQRVGRYIFGGLSYLYMMARDKHPQSRRFSKFFNHIQYLGDKDCVLTFPEWYFAMTEGRKPVLDKDSIGSAMAFVRSLPPPESKGKPEGKPSLFKFQGVLPTPEGSPFSNIGGKPVSTKDDASLAERPAHLAKRKLSEGSADPTSGEQPSAGQPPAETPSGDGKQKGNGKRGNFHNKRQRGNPRGGRGGRGGRGESGQAA